MCSGVCSSSPQSITDSKVAKAQTLEMFFQELVSCSCQKMVTCCFLSSLLVVLSALEL
jgi:hypothetical protein